MLFLSMMRLFLYTNYGHYIIQLVEKLAPYKKLYENCADYKSKYQMWTEAKIGTYEPEEIEQSVETFHCNIIELSKEFSSNPAPYALTNSVSSKFLKK